MELFGGGGMLVGLLVAVVVVFMTVTGGVWIIGEGEVRGDLEE